MSQDNSESPRAPSDSATPKQLMEQLVTMLHQEPGTEAGSAVEARTAALEARISKLEADGTATLNDHIAEKLKKLIGALFLESGFLEKFVTTVVDRKMEALPAGGGGEALAEESSKIAKQFLTENMSALFETEIKAVMEKELQAFLGSDNMKELLDDKFRAVTLYLRTDVIPTAVRQALKSS